MPLLYHGPRWKVKDISIVPIDLGVMLEWGRLTGQLEVAGTPMPAMDALVAAMARQGDFVPVTRNEADFQLAVSDVEWHADVRLVNPWSMESFRA